MNAIAKVALTLVIIGALNWLLVGAFNFNLVAAVFGPMSVVSRIVYILVGLAGVYCITLLLKPVMGATRVGSDYRKAA